MAFLGFVEVKRWDKIELLSLLGLLVILNLLGLLLGLFKVSVRCGRIIGYTKNIHVM